MIIGKVLYILSSVPWDSRKILYNSAFFAAGGPVTTVGVKLSIYSNIRRYGSLSLIETG